VPHFDVIIVGAGMAGSALATSLSQSGVSSQSAGPLSVALVEKRQLPGNRNPLSEGEISSVAGSAVQDAAKNPTGKTVDDYDLRASALTAATISWLDGIGVWDRVREQRSSAFRGMEVWVEEGTGSIKFDAAEIGLKSLGEIVENRLLIFSLLESATASSNVTVFDDVEVVGLQLPDASKEYRSVTPDSVDREKVVLELSNGQFLSSRMVVAADGADSKIRSLAGINVRRWDYGHDAIVCNVQTETPHSAIAYQRFTRTGPAAFLPLDSTNEDSRLCTIVWSQESERAKALMELENRSFSAELAAAIEHRLGCVSAVGRRQSFPLRQMHAVDYEKHGVVLVADAAHTIHPLAGQGINLGLADVAELSGTIAEALGSRKCITDEVLLKRYQRRRKTDNLAMMALVEGFKQVYQPLPLPAMLIRNEGMKLLDRHLWIKQKIIRYAMGMQSH